VLGHEIEVFGTLYEKKKKKKIGKKIKIFNFYKKNRTKFKIFIFFQKNRTKNQNIYFFCSIQIELLEIWPNIYLFISMSNEALFDQIFISCSKFVRLQKPPPCMNITKVVYVEIH